MGKNNKLRKNDIKNCTWYYFDDITRIEDFDFHYILIDKKWYKNILAYTILSKSLIDYKPLRIRFGKIDGFIRVYHRIRFLVLYGNKNMTPFKTGLDILQV